MILFYEIIGFLFTIILGTLLHFTYEWSGRHPFAAVVSATDESVFQHLKLLLVPYILWMIIEFEEFGMFLLNFFPAKLLGAIVGMTLIVVLYYVYTSLLGKNVLFIDILIFILGVAMSYMISFRIMDSQILLSPVISLAAQIVLVILIISFTVFTFYPPKCELFRDPTKKK